jgi:hypothetical protein
MNDYSLKFKVYRDAVASISGLPKLSPRDALLTVLTDKPRSVMEVFLEAQMIAEKGTGMEDLQGMLFDLEDEGLVNFDGLQPYLTNK